MTNFIVILIVIAIVSSAIVYIVKEKKKGVKCIGCPAIGNCPSAGTCGGNRGNHKDGGCSCHADTNK